MRLARRSDLPAAAANPSAHPNERAPNHPLHRLTAAPSPQPITPLILLNLVNGDGTPLQASSAGAFLSVGSSSGLSPPEQLIVYHPSDLNLTQPVEPGRPIILSSRYTGGFCRVAPLPAATVLSLGLPSSCSVSGLLCDAASASGASVLNYAGDGLLYQGRPLFTEYANKMLVHSADPACMPAAASSALGFGPAMRGTASTEASLPALTSYGIYNLNMGEPAALAGAAGQAAARARRQRLREQQARRQRGPGGSACGSSRPRGALPAALPATLLAAPAASAQPQMSARC